MRFSLAMLLLAGCGSADPRMSKFGLSFSRVAIIANAGERVWRPFAGDAQGRHPHAHFKMVIVNIFVDDQKDPDVTAGAGVQRRC